ncbi:glutamate-cysteine ligase family protein [Desulfobotulus sp. H1]|uniref:Glutamate-cysteine ligase family protein n=1 Tax=Desulfobotulus pelophilus TaxID=2823377 RepID=A0ABT3N6D2_9BACT|nr:glutamate-cysteine ligase family protein [Desulfobotulus pelophilus]MCW7753020.1 glutamate-cysteine ligase family protein [Desulfobotulus pelophilus]
MKALHLFEGYGIEIELMIVDAATLTVRALAETLLREGNGPVSNERSLGRVRISNELAAHVIEFKTPGPAAGFTGLTEDFRSAVDEVNRLLKVHGARLLGTGMHPFMNPFEEAVLWPHGQKEIYNAYHRIFDCRGHGWVNLQSVHLNLPFCGADEFGRLHAAIRCVLPLLPGLCASTPMADGQLTPYCDTRLAVYRKNQQRIPEIAGSIIPEAVFDPRSYEREILLPMYHAIAPMDPDEVLRGEWLNSRGAIARFERNAIEIRLVDTQENVEADVAVMGLVAAVVRGFVEERLAPLNIQKQAGTRMLADCLNQAIVDGESALVSDPGLIALYGLDRPKRAGDIWKAWYDRLLPHCPELLPVASFLEKRLEQGTLSSRIRQSLGEHPSPERVRAVYGKLADCLATGRLFCGF